MKKPLGHDKIFCPKCFYSAKGVGTICVKCGHANIPISHKFHLPSRDASKSKWLQFFKESLFLSTGYMNIEANHKLVMETLKTK